MFGERDEQIQVEKTHAHLVSRPSAFCWLLSRPGHTRFLELRPKAALRLCSSKPASAGKRTLKCSQDCILVCFSLPNKNFAQSTRMCTALIPGIELPEQINFQASSACYTPLFQTSGLGGKALLVGAYDRVSCCVHWKTAGQCTAHTVATAACSTGRATGLDICWLPTGGEKVRKEQHFSTEI